MTPAYYAQNAAGYENDKYIGIEITKLCEKFGVTRIYETGTYRGATAKRLSEFAPVCTVEVVKENYDIAKVELRNHPNVYCAFGDSVEWLDVWLRHENPTESILCYLDAHFYEAWPLLDELKTIAKHKVKPVIVIHDFKVPGRPDLGFDSYKGQPLDITYVIPALNEIYGADYDFHYNDKAEGAKRGCFFSYPS